MVLIAHKQLKLDISLQLLLLLHLIELNIFEHISLHDLIGSAQSLEPEWPENTQMPLF